MFELTPFAAATTVAGDTAENLSWGGSLLVLVGWTLPLAAAAILLERRRDVG
jgi:hypothetical protein